MDNYTPLDEIISKNQVLYTQNNIMDQHCLKINSFLHQNTIKTENDIKIKINL